ncbi:MAG: PAS domain S-box protein [Nitrospirae bacterium]|nr:PAS domain S-box protein [Nitrospirota bacterium]
MASRPGSDHMRYKMVLLFIMLALCIVSAGYLYYLTQKEHIKKSIQNELSAIADLKVDQITTWRKERLGNATVIFKNTFIAAAVRKFLETPEAPGLKQELLDWMKSRAETYDYKSVYLVDAQGIIRISTIKGDRQSQLDPPTRKALSEAFNAKHAVLSDIHSKPASTDIHLDLVAPFILRKGSSDVLIGAIVFDIDPHSFLYPLIQTWQGQSETAETVLLRLEGRDILFLNDLRHREQTALTFRIPLDESKMRDIDAARAGNKGVVEQRDYRAVPVLATLRVVPQTSWFLVAKMDLTEIYAPIVTQARQVTFASVLLIAATSLAIVFWWRKKITEYARKQYDAELASKVLSQRYDYLSKYANDIILLCDPEGKILEANDRAIAAYGYSRDELLRLHIRDIRSPETWPDITGQMQQVRAQSGMIFETVHLRKNGEAFPVEVSSRLIDSDGKILFQSIIRDITERKQAEVALINEKNKSQAIIAAIGDGISIQDLDFRVIYQNQVDKNLHGDHIGEYCYQAYEQKDQTCDNCALAASFKDGMIHTTERTVQTANGPLHVEITVSPLKNESGEIVAGIEAVRNITGRKQLENSLRERNVFIEAVMDNLPIGLGVNDIKNGKAIYMNSAFEEIYGWPDTVLVNVTEFFSHVYPDPVQRKAIKERIITDIATGDPSRMRWENMEITTMTGKKKLVNAVNIPVFEQNMMISTVQDVTARKQSEKRLIMLNECLLSFGPNPDENINRLVALCGEQLDAACAIYYRLEGDTLYALGQWNTPPDFEPRAKPEGHFCYDIIKKGGQDVCVIRDLPATSYAQTDPHVSSYGLKTYIGKAVSFGGDFVGALCTAYQIDPMLSDVELKFLEIVASAVGVEESRKETISALRESENRYKRLVRSVTDYIVTIDVENGRAIATYHSPGCVTVTGYTSNEYNADPGLWYRMIFDGDRNTVIEQTNAVLSGAPAAPFEHRIIHKDGSIRWVRHTPVSRADGTEQVITVDSLITDITQLKLLENQLRQAQKMEAVGQLAGGIAHDFNNILTAIIGYSHLLLMKMDAGNPDRPFVQHIIASSERAAHLTQSLLSFSRKQVIDLKPIDLNDIIGRTEHLLGRIIGEDIEFKTMLAEEGLPVLADGMHIEQVLMNLAANARDAMPNGGMLRLESGAFKMGEDFIRTHAYGRPGTYACLSITDTGIGMDENISRRIFEPFFTTKEVGKGTGLGLSMVYGIIKQHHGYIEVYSEPGKGTTFTIYLPLLATAAVEKPATAPAELARGTETVLLAEDDKTVRDLAGQVLENSGYRVIAAADGEEAVGKFLDNRKGIDLLVFDIIMPKKNGKEAYLEIKKIRPDIKALFMSGYTADMVFKKETPETDFDVVLKPISPSDLLKKVREILDR